MALNLFGGNNAPGLGSQTFSDVGSGVFDKFAGALSGAALLREYPPPLREYLPLKSGFHLNGLSAAQQPFPTMR